MAGGLRLAGSHTSRGHRPLEDLFLGKGRLHGRTPLVARAEHSAFVPRRRNVLRLKENDMASSVDDEGEGRKGHDPMHTMIVQLAADGHMFSRAHLP
jgi:hypothetical protein